MPGPARLARRPQSTSRPSRPTSSPARTTQPQGAAHTARTAQPRPSYNALECTDFDLGSVAARRAAAASSPGPQAQSSAQKHVQARLGSTLEVARHPVLSGERSCPWTPTQTVNRAMFSRGTLARVGLSVALVALPEAHGFAASPLAVQSRCGGRAVGALSGISRARSPHGGAPLALSMQYSSEGEELSQSLRAEREGSLTALRKVLTLRPVRTCSGISGPCRAVVLSCHHRADVSDSSDVPGHRPRARAEG
jgi:hypothetical protein